jgi:uncharacterized protein YdcH (DUF465 family)
MKESLRNELEKEYQSWQTSLESFRQENALLKYRLSEMVDNDVENHFLQMAEYFQNELILKDEGLKKLITNTQEFLAEISEVKNEQKHHEILISKKKELRKKISQFEKTFSILSNEFNKKMLRIPEH